MRRLARASFRHRRLVALAWVGVLVVLSVLGSAFGGVFKVEFGLPGSETNRALALMRQHGFTDRSGEQAQVVFEAGGGAVAGAVAGAGGGAVAGAGGGVDAPAVKAPVQQLLARIPTVVRDVQVASPYDQVNAGQISRDGTIAYAEIRFSKRSSKQYADDAKAIRSLRDGVHADGLRIELGGDIFAQGGLGSSEGIGLLLAMVILLVAFGSLLAMGLPIATALVGIGCGTAIVKLIANVLNMPDFTVQAVSMISIGVGIDYALFIVTRYREALHRGAEPVEAVAESLDTAGRAVLFAGTTVVIALLGLLVLQVDTFRGVAIGTAIGVLSTMVVSVTLLPALLGFAGNKIDRFGIHRRGHATTDTPSFWYRWSRVIQRRPWPAFAAALAVLVVLAVPAASLRMGFGDAGNRPANDTTRKAYDLLSQGFGPGFNGPLLLVAETPAGERDLATLGQLVTTLKSTTGVAAAFGPTANAAKDAAIIQVVPTTSPQDEATSSLVRHLRSAVVPAALAGTGITEAIGGNAAAVEDFSRYSYRMLPVVMAIVLVLSFTLLTMVFRSLLVPLKAVIMNLLSVGAAYGLMIAVFQWGWGLSLVGVGRKGPIDAWGPLMLFAVVFGLSMDYEVFLLSRIKEEHDRTGDNATAVADGLARTARVISAAALIMVCVFGAFVMGNERSLKLFGLGMAAAVLVDATIVRLVLVPATMELLGDRNWWMPGWLDRWLPRLHVEGSTVEVCDHVGAHRRPAGYLAAPDPSPRRAQASGSAIPPAGPPAAPVG